MKAIKECLAEAFNTATKPAADWWFKFQWRHQMRKDKRAGNWPM